MRRRSFLAVTGLGASLALGGCLGVAEQTPENESLHLNDLGQVTDFPRYEQPDASTTIGSREGVSHPAQNLPHDLLVWNAATTRRDVTVTIERLDSGDRTSVLQESYQLASEDLLEIQIKTPGTYEVRIEWPALDEPATIEVPRTRFDCNESHHEITLTRENRVKHVVYSTDLGCQPPTSSPTASDS